MDKKKLLLGLVIILAILNIGLMIMMFSQGRGPGPQPPSAAGKDDPIKEALNMNEAQYQTFIESRNKHKEVFQPLQKDLRMASEKYYGLTMELSEQERKALLAEILSISERIIETNVTHLEEVKSNLNPDQLPDYRKFVRSLLNNMENKSPKKGRPPRDF